MKTAAISELKARLGKYLNRAEAGEEILIRVVGKRSLVYWGFRRKELWRNHGGHEKTGVDNARVWQASQRFLDDV